MFERVPSSRPTSGQPAFDPTAARTRGDQALARALVLRHALDELDQRRFAARGGVPAQPPRAGTPQHGAVGFGRENRPEDLRLARRQLAALGYAPTLQTWQDLPFFDPLLDTGLRAFQTGRGLQVDGWMRPGGETERALAAELATHRPPAATPANALKPPAPSFGTVSRDAGVPQDGNIQLAHANPLLREGARWAAPILAGPLAYALQTYKPLRDQLRHIGIDPDEAIAALSDLGGGPLTPTDQRLQQFLDAQPALSLDPTDMALQTVLRAYLTGRTLAAEAPGSDVTTLPTSDATSRFDTPDYDRSERRQTSPLGPTPPFEPDLPPEDDRTESRPAERTEPTILPGGLEGIEFPHTTQIPIADDDLPRIFAFPGDPSEFPQIDIVERKGNALTKAEIDQIRNDILDSNKGWKHKNGGRNRKTGAEMSEYRVPGWGSLFKDEKGRPGDSRPGSFFTDLTFETPDGRIVHVQHADVDRNGNIRGYEWEKANTIRDHTGHDVILIGKKWQQRN